MVRASRLSSTKNHFFWPAILLLAASLVSAQTPPRIINQGGTIVIQGSGVIPPGLDPQMAALMQQAGVDQNVTASAEFDPPVIPLTNRSTYRVTVTAMTEGVSLPDPLPTVPGLEMTLAGRGFNYGGGGPMLQPRTTFNYRVTATQTGSFVMPSFTASANGKTIRVPEARLTVLPAGAAVVRPALRLVAEVSEGEFYIGQAVPVRVTLADPGDGSVQALSQPQISGEAFMSEPLPTRYRREMRPGPGGGVLTAHVCEVFAYPVKEGRLAFTATAYAHVRRPGTNPLLGAPLDTVFVDSDPVTITVKHLPKEGELPGFTGGIGTFAVEPPKPSTNQVRAGEPLTLTVTVRGEGNLTRLIPPKLERARDWQSFPPLADTSGAMQIQLRGSVLFTYTLIPLSERVVATPAIPFCYFDPRRAAYVDATIPPVPIKVTPAPGGALAAASSGKSAVPDVDDPDHPAGERELVMTGLAETPGRRASSLTPLQARGWFLALQLVPAGVLSGLWLWDRRRRFLEAHPEVVLKARARRGLRREARRARRAAAARDAVGFVTAAVNALREAGAPFAAANPGALVCADVLAALAPAERQGTEGQLVRTLFGVAEAQRFLQQSPDSAAVLALQPQVEALLRKWRERL